MSPFSCAKCMTNRGIFQHLPPETVWPSSCSSGHTTLKQRHSTFIQRWRRYINVETTLFQRCMPAGVEPSIDGILRVYTKGHTRLGKMVTMLIYGKNTQVNKVRPTSLLCGPWSSCFTDRIGWGNKRCCLPDSSRSPRRYIPLLFSSPLYITLHIKFNNTITSVGRAMLKCAFGHMRTANVESSLRFHSAQSDQGLHC